MSWLSYNLASSVCQLQSKSSSMETASAVTSSVVEGTLNAVLNMNRGGLTIIGGNVINIQKWSGPGQLLWETFFHDGPEKFACV